MAEDQPKNTTPLPGRFKWIVVDPSHGHKGVDWYWAVGLITVSLVVSVIFFGKFLLAILVAAAGGVLIMQSIKTPEKESVIIGEKGVTVGHEYYPYRNLTSFWVETEEDEQPKLLLHSLKTFMPMIAIPISPSINTEELADFLLEHLDEEKLVEPFPQRIMEWLGF